LLPAFDSGEDALRIGRPNEGLGVDDGIGDEAVDGELQVNDGLFASRRAPRRVKQYQFD
jgi:hypothetical protein